MMLGVASHTSTFLPLAHVLRDYTQDAFWEDQESLIISLLTLMTPAVQSLSTDANVYYKQRYVISWAFRAPVWYQMGLHDLGEFINYRVT